MCLKATTKVYNFHETWNTKQEKMTKSPEFYAIFTIKGLGFRIFYYLCAREVNKTYYETETNITISHLHFKCIKHQCKSLFWLMRHQCKLYSWHKYRSYENHWYRCDDQLPFFCSLVFQQVIHQNGWNIRWRDEHWRRGVLWLLRPHLRHHPQQRDKHWIYGVWVLLRPYLRHHPQQRDKHWKVCVRRLLWPYLRHHPQQRDEYWIWSVLYLYLETSKQPQTMKNT